MCYLIIYESSSTVDIAQMACFEKSVRINTSMHVGGVELTKLTYNYSGTRITC